MLTESISELCGLSWCRLGSTVQYTGLYCTTVPPWLPHRELIQHFTSSRTAHSSTRTNIDIDNNVTGCF